MNVVLAHELSLHQFEPVTFEARLLVRVALCDVRDTLLIRARSVYLALAITPSRCGIIAPLAFACFDDSPDNSTMIVASLAGTPSGSK